MTKDNVLVLVPTYNNFLTIEKVAKDILDHGYDVIVVDDGSNSPISELPFLKNKEIKTIRHSQNQGKGQAILTGAREVQKLGYKFFITMDGDGQHMAAEIPKLLKARESEQEIIIGARNFQIQNVPRAAKFGRWFSNFWAILNTSQSITDSLSGFRLYPISILDLPVKSKKYDFEMEILVRHAWEKRKIKEVTIECYYPPFSERVSHFHKLWDTLAIVKVHFRLLPLRVLLLKGFL